MKRLIPFLALIFLSPAPALSASNSEHIDLDAQGTTIRVEARRTFLVGTWHRKQRTKQDGVSEETAEMYRDGTYRFTFRTKAGDSPLEEYVEVGRWGLVDDIHFTIATGHVKNGKLIDYDTSDPRRYAVYEVLDLTKNRFRYRHKITGNTYQLRRVLKSGNRHRKSS